MRNHLILGLVLVVGCSADEAALEPRPGRDAAAAPDSGRHADAAEATEAGVAASGAPDGGAVADAGEEADSGRPPTECAQVNVTVAAWITATTLDARPFDLLAVGDALWLTWFDDTGLRLVRLALDGTAVGETWTISGPGEAPRVFVGDDGEPAVAYIHQTGNPVGSPTHRLRISDASTTSTLAEVTGALAFGMDAERPGDGHPPLVYWPQPIGAAPYGAVLASGSARPLSLDVGLGDSRVLGLQLDDATYTVFSWRQGQIDVHQAGPLTMPRLLFTAGADGPSGISTFAILRNADGSPVLFYALNEGRLAQLLVRRFDDTDPVPVLVQRSAGISFLFDVAPVRTPEGWAAVWPDFRDTLIESNYFVPRSLYFGQLGSDGAPIEEDRRVVDGEGEDVSFVDLVRVRQGLFAAAYTLGSSLALRVVIGDFRRCPTVEAARIQRMP